MKIIDILENTVLELDNDEKAKTANNIYMRFGVKKPPVTTPGDQGKPYVVGYAGFANSPSEVTANEAKWKFYNLKVKQDFVNAIKKIMSDKVFTAAGGVTIYVDSPSMLSKYPGFGEFITMAEKSGGGKIRVEYKPEGSGDGEKGSGKKRVKAKWANPRDEYDTPAQQTTRYFTVTSPTLMNQLRRNDRVMQYYRPNKNAFVMGQKEFNAFVQAFGRDNIKIVGRFKEDIEETATAGGTSAGGIAGFAVGIGEPPKKKTKTKLIKR
jgi:hypothetical protein